jgi:hypothetical protein
LFDDAVVEYDSVVVDEDVCDSAYSLWGAALFLLPLGEVSDWVEFVSESHFGSEDVAGCLEDEEVTGVEGAAAAAQSRKILEDEPGEGVG